VSAPPIVALPVAERLVVEALAKVVSPVTVSVDESDAVVPTRAP
jgi:hypothetical protein